MSFTYGFPSDQVISYVSSTVVQNYCIVASATFVVYDHVCTIADEVQLIWGRKLTGPTILFYINRWMLMIFAILNVAQVFYHPQTILRSVHQSLQDTGFELHT
ncbi:hypothetical protein CERSUDRAFT_100614 [Gelatoporia subvermispora B]|uniref:DUF6533 domain-containing protein n=1 Tax=Ceriporiopsis subvermispora (strain B) TaxID=914234 RepID=M2QX94_CERS8|nr:hypothetical protein CERSUDRAFT_100614 [Gelatoporia subvermispora B]